MSTPPPHLRAPCSAPSTRAFTLMELLIVISVIAVLAGLLFPAVGMIKRQALQLKDANQLKQIALGLEVFRQDHDEKFPYSLLGKPTALPSTTDASFATAYNLPSKIFLSPADVSHGKDKRMGRPDDSTWGNYDRLFENNCSYVYEASGDPDPIKFTAGDIGYFYRNIDPNNQPAMNTKSWADGKINQVKFGNLVSPAPAATAPAATAPEWQLFGAPFSSSQVPILRCYHHDLWTHRSDPLAYPRRVLNISFDFNVFWSVPFWELEINPAIPH